MTRYAHGYRKIFLAHNGSGPWTCAYTPCGELIYVLGKRSREGAIHHKDEDKHNNDPDNLEIMHFGCHRRHHMVGHIKAPETCQRLSDALQGHPVSAETRAKISAANRGKQSSLGRVPSQVTREKLRNMGKAVVCECGMTTYPGSMASHLKASGHRLVSGE